MSVVVKFEKEVKNCSECPFRAYETNHGGPNGYVCKALIKTLSYGAFIPNDAEIHPSCPYLK